MGKGLESFSGNESNWKTSVSDALENEAVTIDGAGLYDLTKEETEESSEEETAESSEEETAESSGEETAESSGEETAESPEEETAESSEEETTESSEEETAESSEEETAESSEEETTESSERETTESVEETSEAIEDENPNGEKEKASERGRAEPISMFDILSISGLDSSRTPKKEVFRSQYGILTTKNKYQREGMKLEIRRRGSDGSVYTYTSDCEMPTSDPPYNTIKDAYGGLVEWSYKSNIVVTNPEASELHIQFNILSPSGDFTRKIVINLVDNHDAAPETPQIVYDQAHPDSYVLTGIDSTMEYTVTTNRFEKAAFTWASCTDEDIILTPPSSTTFYLVRYKATSDSANRSIKN